MTGEEFLAIKKEVRKRRKDLKMFEKLLDEVYYLGYGDGYDDAEVLLENSES